MLADQSLPPWQTERYAQLAKRLAVGRFPTGLLLTGPAGVGKQALANALVRAAFCVDRSAEAQACGRCIGCQQFNAGSHPDFVLCVPEEGKQSITVDAIREFGRKLYLTPQTAAGRLGYIPQADLLNVNAANALLKTLEEPPASAHLLLVSDRPATLPATIRSRCEQVRAVVNDAERVDVWFDEVCPDLSPALRRRFRHAPLQAMQASELTRQESTIRQQLDAIWSQQRDPILAAGALDDELLTAVGPSLFRLIAERLRSVASQSLPSDVRLGLQRLADANASALHLNQTSQANLRMLVETQLIEWARMGRLMSRMNLNDSV
ncbi:DNA polymerase III subunit delta' [Abyssibacter profundi]|uniref:DNA-directed DNA polymerase n=1 Tax=Abyssibacter profundi TaxID=2182787 RepID=A0A363UN92_9GAMM|nr:DNA polymerase III subunit delta' [Abyssibacter profundi]PWN56896.1 hypothetical protein DEH80_05630 [Abyssibacter profundi]